MHNPERRERLLALWRALGAELEAEGYSPEALLHESSAEILLPIDVFSDAELTPLEAAASYLAAHEKDERTIAALLNRPLNVVRAALANTKRKRPKRASWTSVSASPYTVPVRVLADRARPASEQLYMYLRERYGLTNTQLARMTGRDARTVWTVLSRATKRKVKP